MPFNISCVKRSLTSLTSNASLIIYLTITRKINFSKIKYYSRLTLSVLLRYLILQYLK